MAIGILATAALATGISLVGASSASAHDHLFGGAHSAGVDARGFVNPVGANPSGTSGAAAQPGTVPGLGSPDSGTATGTPSFDCDILIVRLDQRSNGVGPSCG
jgi:hypothetical protein